MELMGFGRRLDPDTLARMGEGSAWHQRFQDELQASGVLIAKEASVRDAERGISGRMDAVVETGGGPAVVEYKTVSPERFDAILRVGAPPVSFWAQLHVYLTLTGYLSGRLVVDARESPRRRLVFYAAPEEDWSDWVLERVRLARSWAEERRLPDREPGAHCLSCDRWERCYRNEEERDRAVSEHPEWEPTPALPLLVPLETAQDL